MAVVLPKTVAVVQTKCPLGRLRAQAGHCPPFINTLLPMSKMAMGAVDFGQFVKC